MLGLITTTPLPPLWKNRVSEIFDGNEEDDLNIIIDKFDIVMVQRNLKWLRNSNTMLNDEVVNFSLNLSKGTSAGKISEIIISCHNFIKNLLKCR